MKLNYKSRVKASARALVDDLSAVRAAVSAQRASASAQNDAAFEARLFESWVLDRLAQHESQLAILVEQVGDMAEELVTLRKELPRLLKQAAKANKKG
jgi:hypothetical protein